MYRTDYDKLQPYFGQEKTQCLYIDNDAFVVSNISKDIFEDLGTLSDLSISSKLGEDRGL